MKISPLFLILFLFAMSSTGCEKQDLGSIDASFIYAPTAIATTSQDDNIFYIKVFSDNPEVEFTIIVIEIFDRYGNPVFKAEQFPTNDSTYGWDGTVDGELVETGSYSYSSKISDGTGSLLFVGEFSLLR